MALTSAYVLPIGRIPDLFKKIRDGQAPIQVTIQLIKDWGFKSTNDRAFIPLLKALGFLSADGKPTQRYSDYRDHSKSKTVMAEAIKEAYGDLLLISAIPTDSDRTAIEGKFKSFHNVSDNVAGLMCKTFYALLSLADLKSNGAEVTEHSKATVEAVKPSTIENRSNNNFQLAAPSLNYNIQIHLPATKDAEVYNAIFKSLRDHLIEQ
jgi:hypothetical protein